MKMFSVLCKIAEDIIFDFYNISKDVRERGYVRGFKSKHFSAK